MTDVGGVPGISSHFKNESREGDVAVVWPDDASKAIVTTALKEGKTYHKFSGDEKEGSQV